MRRGGQGYDVHRLKAGLPLVLGGVEIPAEAGLVGHSDADVLIHALCDALLGAAALGDIGQHFPDDDSRHAGRSSREFLCQVRGLLQAAAWRIVNIDTTLLAQRPQLAPYLGAMRQNLADDLGLEKNVVSIKATTTEGLGFVGRGEGMAAQAIVLIEST